MYPFMHVAHCIFQKRSMERFEAQFRGYKTDRKLKWSPTQGCITVELEFGDRTAEFRVDSIKALVISVFNDSGNVRMDLPHLSSG